TGTAANGVGELPDDVPVAADLEDASAVRLRDQRVAVSEPLAVGADVAFEGRLRRSRVLPYELHRLRVELDHARTSFGLAEVAAIVEQQDVAVLQDVRIMLPGPVAPRGPHEAALIGVHDTDGVRFPKVDEQLSGTAEREALGLVIGEYVNTVGMQRIGERERRYLPQ